MRKPVGHVSLHRVEEPESVWRIVCPTVEPSNIELFKRYKVRTRFKTAKQRLRPGIVLLLEKRSHLGEGFCGEAGWLFLGRRAEAGHNETQCTGEEQPQNSGSSLLRGKRYLRLNTD